MPATHTQLVVSESRGRNACFQVINSLFQAQTISDSRSVSCTKSISGRRHRVAMARPAVVRSWLAGRSALEGLVIDSHAHDSIAMRILLGLHRLLSSACCSYIVTIESPTDSVNPARARVASLPSALSRVTWSMSSIRWCMAALCTYTVDTCRESTGWCAGCVRVFRPHCLHDNARCRPIRRWLTAANPTWCTEVTLYRHCVVVSLCRVSVHGSLVLYLCPVSRLNEWTDYRWPDGCGRMSSTRMRALTTRFNTDKYLLLNIHICFALSLRNTVHG